MLLFTTRQIKENQRWIQEFLDTFKDSEVEEEEFFVHMMPYILKADFVYCPEVSGEIVGLGYIFYIKGVFPNLGMIVRKEWQGKGIGQNIMEIVLMYIRQNGGCLWSCLWDKNNAIIKLHLKNGFTKYVGSKRGIGWYGISFGSGSYVLKRLTIKSLKEYEKRRKIRIIDLENITMPEVEKFLSEYDGPDYYPVNYEIIEKQAIYIVGLRVNSNLVGIAGIYRVCGATGNFTIIKPEHQGEGFGYKAISEMIRWEKAHKIPFVIALYRNKTLENQKREVGFKSITRIGPWSYAILPLVWWSWAIVPVFPIIARAFHFLKQR